MEIAHYFEWEQYMTGGHLQSVKNQRKILDRRDIPYTTSPDLSADILHLNNYGPKSLYYARKATKNDVPVVIHTHQTVEDLKDSFLLSNLWAPPLRPYLKYIYSLADLLICPSAHNQDVIDDYVDRPSTVISNGVDTDKLEGWDDPALRAEYLDRYNLEPPVVFNVGHVIRRKGLDTFIATARQMPDTDFVWFGFLNPLGDGSTSILQGRKTMQLVENAPDNCQFTGYIDDIRGAYAAGDIFYFPTRNENQGIALLEAMACGKPVVTRDIPTYENWLEHEEHCLKADSVDGFTDQLRRLMDGGEVQGRIGGNAADLAEEHSLDAVGDRLVAAYERVL